MSASPEILSAIFSDETPLFRFPSEPDPGETVTIRIRVAKSSASRIIVFFDTLTVGTLMSKARTDDYFDYFESSFVCNEDEIIYRFMIETSDGASVAYDKVGPRVVDCHHPDFNPCLPGPKAPCSTRSSRTGSATATRPTMS